MRYLGRYVALSATVLLVGIAFPRGAGAREHVEAAGKKLAAELLEVVAAKLGGAPQRVMVEPLKSKRDDAIVRAFNAALLAGVMEHPGTRAVDRAAFEAALQEVQLAVLTEQGHNDTMAEIAVAFGADLWITGNLDRFGKTYRANARALDPGTGVVVGTAQISFTVTGEDGKAEAIALDIQLRILSDQIAKGLDVTGDARYRRFAMMPFEEVGKTTVEKQLGTLVTAEITTLLQRDHGLILVEREKIAQLIEEMALSQTGLISEEQTAEVGRLVGADALVIGSVAEAGENYLVNTRVVDTATGELLLAEKIKLPAADLIALSSEAVVLRSKSGAFFRSMLIPGWGQFYNRDPIKGVAMASSFGVSLAGALTFQLIGGRHEAKYFNLGAGSQRFDREAQLANEALSVRNVFLLVAAGLYALNIIDALISGYSG